MHITIKDIAKECGVSVATVSMALSTKENRVSEKTKVRVREVAKKYNYQPNNAAVSLVNRKSKLIGIVFSDLRNTHIASLFMAINSVLEREGYSLVCHIVEEESCLNEDLIRNVEVGSISGLIWARPLEKRSDLESKQLNAAIKQLDIPIVTMDQYGFDCSGVDVVFDYQLGGYLATRHLIECGHRRIGCIAGKRSFQVTQSRMKGYLEALAEANIPFDPELIFYGDYTMDSGYKAFSYIMGQKVTAIFSMNDEMAFGVYRAARMYGVNIPEDVSMIGFDDVPFADVMQVPLTTIRVPVEEMGRYMGERLVQLVKGEPEIQRTTKVYKPQLLVRASTKMIEK